MKKLLFILGVISLQITIAQEIKFGVKGGVNIASLSFESEEGMSKSPKIGFHVGGIVEIKLLDKFAVQPEVLFSIQGVKQKYSGSFFEAKVKTRLNYVNLPVLAKYFITEKFSIEAGPQISFLVSAKEHFEVTAFGDTVRETEDIKKYYETVDFGLGFGLGYVLESGIFFQGRYNLGLTDIAKNKEGKALKNSVFQMSVGYRF